MREIIKPAFGLLIVTVIAAALLGFVFNITEPIIAAQKVTIKAESLKKVIPNATDFKNEENVTDEGNVTSYIEAYDNDTLVGFVVTVAPKGYSGKVETLVGMDLEGKIVAINIISQSETPGLGANAIKEDFTNQYKDKIGKLNVTKTVPKDDEIQAMTSATITTQAVTNGTNDAYAFYEKVLTTKIK